MCMSSLIKLLTLVVLVSSDLTMSRCTCILSVVIVLLPVDYIVSFIVDSLLFCMHTYIN